MDLQKTKIFLDKINREYGRMSKDPDNIMRIDVDIMLSYVRDLYDAVLSEASGAAPAPRREAAPPTPPPASAAPAAVAVAAPPAIAEPAPPPEEKPAPAPPPPPVLSEAIKASEPLPILKPQAPAAPAPSFPAAPPDAEALFEQKQAVELSEKLSELPIPDLRKAIGLNDKLLLTRELFGEDNAALEKTVETLNGFSSMEQAKAYLLDHCVMRYRWTDKKRLEVAKKFIKLVRRRYS
ncbi:MAG: hypothetical protein IPM98_14940 [Lewinellaceae bacterium]|nr:hypothetical protein [Lewinellaceae bacterium]